VVLWFSLALRVSGSRSTACLVALTVGCSLGFLLYAHSGCAYIPGLMCITGSVFLIGRNRLTAAAVLYAIGTLFWFPFVLAGGAMLLSVSCPSANWNAPLRH